MKDKVMDKDGNEIIIEVFHPGVYLKEEIKRRGILNKDFAKQLLMKPSHLCNLFKGNRNITINIALLIEKSLNIRAEYWLLMQMDYDLYVTRKVINKNK